MNPREKILAAIVVALVAALVGNWWYANYRDQLMARRTAVQDAKARLADVNLALAEGRRAVQQLERWQERSLPSNRERTATLYRAWLLAKAKEAGLTVDDMKPAARTSTSPAYATVGYQMEASGPLPAVAALLYEFYRSPLLHQVTRLRFDRPPGQTNVGIGLEVEALCLPGASKTEELRQGDSHRLQLANLEAYQKILSERDLLSVYTPRATPAVVPAAPTDESAQARFSATVPAGNGLQAWINVPSTGETLHLSAGDAVKIGALEGKIISIEPRSLVWQSGDKKLRVALGQSLRGGTELNAESAPVNDSRGNRPES